MAEHMRVTQSTVCRSESGEREVTVNELFAFCEACSTDFDELVEIMKELVALAKQRHRKRPVPLAETD